MAMAVSNDFNTFSQLFWENHRPAFDPKTNMLLSVSCGYQGPFITDLQKIAESINQLAKPVYYEIDKFYHFFKNVEFINQLIAKENGKYFVDLKSITASLQPIVAELEKKLWAVHVSDFLWTDAILKPFRKVVNSQIPADGVSFTVHFTLGEMVRPHSRVRHWKYCNIAVITPVSEIIKKLISIYSYDTVVHGSWEISNKAVVIVPTDILMPDVYREKEIDVVKYNPREKSLRKIIKEQIALRNGVTIKMIRNVLRPGAPAFLYGNRSININTEEFFRSFFETYKTLSFGLDNFTVNNRCAFFFGDIRQFSYRLCDLYVTDPSSWRLTEAKFYFQYCYDKTRGFLSNEEIVQIEALLSRIKIPDKIPNHIIPYPWTDFLCNLNIDEYNAFKEKCPSLFLSQVEYIVDAAWAVKRWLLVGAKRAKNENLEAIYKKNLTLFLEKNVGVLNSDITDAISSHLELESERKELALYILSLQETRDYNFYVAYQITEERKRGFKVASKDGSYLLTDYTTESIESVLSKHSKTHEIFENDAILQAVKQLKDYMSCKVNCVAEYLEIFAKVPPIKIQTDEQILKNSFSNACHAIEFTPDLELEKEFLRTPMRLLPFLPKSILLIWKTSYGAKHLWRRFSLEVAFTKEFSDETLFWDSEQSFLQIYRKLKSS